MPFYSELSVKVLQRLIPADCSVSKFGVTVQLMFPKERHKPTTLGGNTLILITLRKYDLVVVSTEYFIFLQTRRRLPSLLCVHAQSAVDVRA